MSPKDRKAPPSDECPHFPPDDESRGAGLDDAGSSPLSPNSPANHRNTFRCPIQPECQDAFLVIGRQKHPVRLLDQSAKGFCVSCSRQAKVETGQVLQLCSLAGEHQVQVVHVEKDDDALHVGLQRLRPVVRRPGEFAGRLWFLVLVVTIAALFCWAF